MFQKGLELWVFSSCSKEKVLTHMDGTNYYMSRSGVDIVDEKRR